MARKAKGKKKAKPAGPNTFKLWVDNEGRIVKIQPSSGSPIEGFAVAIYTQPATKMVNGVMVNGFAIKQLDMVVDDSGPCCWKKIGGVWQCGPC
jgi:hypothetical protein